MGRASVRARRLNCRRAGSRTAMPALSQFAALVRQADPRGRPNRNRASWASRWRRQVEQATYFRPSQYLREIERHRVDDVLEQTPFAAQDGLDALLHGLFAGVGVDVHGIHLAQPMTAILGLTL